MKKIHSIKDSLLKATLVTSVFLMASCSSSPKPEDTKVVAEEHNEAKFDNNKQEKDAQFLVNAAEINLEHIQLGQLAQQSGTAMHVKELGEIIEVAHTKLQGELNTLAQRKSITIPGSSTEDTQDAYKKLQEKSGNDFDKAYADRMVNEYKDAIATFEKAATDCEDTDIKNWANATLPDLRKYLDLSIECQKKCEKR